MVDSFTDDTNPYVADVKGAPYAGLLVMIIEESNWRHHYKTVRPL
jgi:hypothetical protein